MPNKHFYIAMGVATGACVVAAVRVHRKALFDHFAWFRALYRWDRDWFLYFPLAFLPFVAWALVPDILHGTGVLPKEVTRGPFFDIFYFHSTFEILEDTNAELDWLLNTLGSLVLLAAAVGTFAFYVREYKRAVDQARASLDE